MAVPNISEKNRKSLGGSEQSNISYVTGYLANCMEAWHHLPILPGSSCCLLITQQEGGLSAAPRP